MPPYGLQSRVSNPRPAVSFVAKKLLAERDYSVQEVCHLLLGLPLHIDTRIVTTVDCRPLNRQTRGVSDLGDGALSTRENLYQKYLGRSIEKPEFASLSFFDMLTYWNYKSGNSNNWRVYAKNRSKPRVLNYFPRYEDNEQSP